MRYPGRPGGNLYSDAVEAFTGLLSRHGAIPSIGMVEDELGIDRGGLLDLFPDENALLGAMAQNALMRLHDQFVRVMAGVTDSDPITQFEMLADVYVEWAYLHPREASIIGSMPDNEFRQNGELMRYETAIHELMQRMLGRACDMGLLDKDEDLELLVSTAHTFAFGAITKMLVGDLGRWLPGMTEREAVRKMLHTFVRKILRKQ
ncbi:hypothetical protein RM190_17805 [Paracoccus sp. CPCC 101403]|uniref:TetR/AcrR family transcriptional regulator n=2 Tax=Paracoccus broussonetiae TaxID=3075834 RepID=A0ABU3EIW3_9RHOB|nr:hypothetical protein [Paracoccus sp. CPCC 101403]MDT1063727.1 hypothetical protein [Paracoccus sp. CPCC 101403]